MSHKSEKLNIRTSRRGYKTLGDLHADYQARADAMLETKRPLTLLSTPNGHVSVFNTTSQLYDWYKYDSGAMESEMWRDREAAWWYSVC